MKIHKKKEKKKENRAKKQLIKQNKTKYTERMG